MQIDGEFPGGNVIVDRIVGDEVYFRPDLRDTEGHWFYWCLRVKDARGRRLVFRPTLENILTVRGPAISVDGGWYWKWLPKSAMAPDRSFTVDIPEAVDEVRLSMAMPYGQAQLEAFAARHAKDIRVSELCRSRKTAAVACWQIGPPVERAAHRVVLTARHHCCEMTASYVLEGLIDAVLHSRDTWWRDQVSVTVVPFVDWDGVSAGDQGKNRVPRDHNRDYDGESIYPESVAIQHRVAHLAEAGLDAVLDFHCPWIHGDEHEHIYMVGLENPARWREQQRFGKILERSVRGELKYRCAHDVPFGQSWNNPSNYTRGKSFIGWAAGLAGTRLCSTFEIPYAVVGEQILDQANASAFGGDLAAALRTYLTNQTKEWGL